MLCDGGRDAHSRRRARLVRAGVLPPLVELAADGSEQLEALSVLQASPRAVQSPSCRPISFVKDPPYMEAEPRAGK